MDYVRVLLCFSLCLFGCVKENRVAADGDETMPTADSSTSTGETDGGMIEGGESGSGGEAGSAGEGGAPMGGDAGSVAGGSAGSAGNSGGMSGNGGSVANPAQPTFFANAGRPSSAPPGTCCNQPSDGRTW